MNDAVDRLIVERAALDRGFSRGFVMSAVGHLVLVGAAIAGPLLMPKKPLISIAPAFVVSIPRGGGGSPTADPAPAPKVDPKKPDPPKPEPEPPKKKEVIKPPKDEKKGLPLKDLKKPVKGTATPTAAPAAAGATGGTGKGANNPLGVGIGPVGPGIPEGTDLSGDFYMGAVVGKIARIWRSRIQQGVTTSVVVRFTILADGSVTEVQVTESSGAYLLDSAAKSAVVTAAPFGKLPAHYDTQYCNAARCTVQVRFTH